MIGAMFAAMKSIMARPFRAARRRRSTAAGWRRNSASSSSALLVCCRRVGSSIRPRRKATRLISSETPWMPSSTHAERQQREHRPADQAAGVRRHLARHVGPGDDRPGEVDDDDDEGEEEQADAEDVDPDLRSLREAAQDDVDPNVVLAHQRVAGGEQEHRREQVPLDLEQRVRAGVEGLADDGVAGADEDRREDQPGDPAADPFAEAVDPAREGEQCRQRSSPG